MLPKPERHAATLAAFIIDDLKLRRKDWALVASLLGDKLICAAANDAMRRMLDPTPAFYARRAAIVSTIAQENSQ